MIERKEWGRAEKKKKLLVTACFVGVGDLIFGDTFSHGDGEEEPADDMTDDNSDDEPNVHGHDDEHGDIVQEESETEQDGGD